MGIELAKPSDPNSVDIVDKEISDLAQLPPNWDGYGAPVIDRAVISAARKFVRSLPEVLVCRPKVVPLSAGTLQLEWHNGPRVLELDFEDPRTIHYLQWHPQAHTEEEHTFPASDIAKAVELVQWFTNAALR
jgi:hypothetical protein